MAEYTLLDYGPRRASSERYRSRRWLAWPAQAFRVVAPRPIRNELDCIQRAVLALLRASALSDAELAQHLALAPRLVAHVVHELQAAAYMDSTRQLTEGGRGRLDEADVADAQLVAAWVFADPWTGDLWPFVTSELARVELRESGSRRPQVPAGVVTARPLSPWWVRDPGRHVDPPDATATLKAAARHADEEQWNQGMPEPLFRRLGAIEASPRRIHLLTYVYVPEDSSGADWTVCDPFGRGASRRLRAALLEHSARDVHLFTWLDSLLERGGGPNLNALREQERALEVEASRALGRRFGSRISEFTEIYGHLRDALVERESARALDGPSQLRRCGSGALASRMALEALLAQLARRWELHGLALADDSQLRTGQICTAAATCGLGLPDSLLRVTPGQLRSVTRYRDSWRARPLLLATLLCARREPSHPMRAAALREPALLERFDEALQLFGGGLHTSEQAGRLSFVELEHGVELTLRIVELLLGLHSLGTPPNSREAS